MNLQCVLPLFQLSNNLRLLPFVFLILPQLLLSGISFILWRLAFVLARRLGVLHLGPAPCFPATPHKPQRDSPHISCRVPHLFYYVHKRWMSVDLWWQEDVQWNQQIISYFSRQQQFRGVVCLLPKASPLALLSYHYLHIYFAALRVTRPLSCAANI